MEEILTDLADIGSALAVIVAIIALVITIQFTRWGKRVDITDAFLRRYDDLMEDRANIKDEAGAELYWRRFWHLQQEEYIMWKKGIVDKNFYKMWLNYRRIEWEENEEVGNVSYCGAFMDMEKRLDKNFYKHMMNVFGENAPLKERNI